ncbi:dihydroxyacetone kinase phosphoryl donor subunit DhaM [Boudabousia marimammalium]|uniref:Phosphocarrier protein HPr n=1 Tax=Boudabousia marimammalium TaxID=156892 RepID=A0A1Q5PT11_9ACTO|nr:dihydroxyacetone kinase phosphoryl donor subunit DhaM [Boudabousia marimammalium]OKL50510.1 hypothetical protein BM477_00620 [Boudabousia marimammalium]
MIGIVLVSHSHALAAAARDLAQIMLPDDGPKLLLAAGIEGGAGFGTDAVAVSEAIAEADSGDGVLVLVDMGSALISTDMAFEFLDPELAERTRVAAAPFVEGLVAAAVTAAGGGSLAAVAASAESALEAKREALANSSLPAMTISEDEGEGAAAAESAVSAAPSGGGDDSLTKILTINDPVGLHARPAAVLATAMGEFDAEIEAFNDTDGTGPVDAASVMMLTTLGVKGGGQLRLVASGPDAAAALAKAEEVVADL